MPTLLITLAGPQQAWGSRSRFAARRTERAPTRSGVIGLLAAALGFVRTESLDRFAGLDYGVRIDQPGHMERDFQTARTLDGRASMPLSGRFYLADAIFLAAIGSSDRPELERFRHALARPVFPLYLGRRAFPPAGPLATQIVNDELRDALVSAPWQAASSYRRLVGTNAPSLEILADARPREAVDLSLRDVPRSFDPRRRQHDWRDVRVWRAPPPDGVAGRPPHDPLMLVSDEEV